MTEFKKKCGIEGKTRARMHARKAGERGWMDGSWMMCTGPSRKSGTILGTHSLARPDRRRRRRRRRCERLIDSHLVFGALSLARSIAVSSPPSSSSVPPFLTFFILASTARSPARPLARRRIALFCGGIETCHVRAFRQRGRASASFFSATMDDSFDKAAAENCLPP